MNQLVKTARSLMLLKWLTAGAFARALLEVMGASITSEPKSLIKVLVGIVIWLALRWHCSNIQKATAMSKTKNDMVIMKRFLLVGLVTTCLPAIHPFFYILEVGAYTFVSIGAWILQYEVVNVGSDRELLRLSRTIPTEALREENQ